MPMSFVRVIIDQSSSHDQVTRDPICVLLRKGLQLEAGVLVKLSRVKRFRDVGILMPSSYRTQFPRSLLFRGEGHRCLLRPPITTSRFTVTRPQPGSLRIARLTLPTGAMR